MLALAGLAAWSIWVDAPPPTPACALADDVAAALTALVPEAAVHGGPAPAADDLRLTIDPGATGASGPGGAAVHLRLDSADGATLLERALPAAASCPELAEGVALVVERYLHDLGWQPGDVEVAGDVAAPGVTNDGAGATSRRASPPRRDALRIDAGARAELAIGATQPGVAAAVTIGGRALRLGVELGAVWPHREDVTSDDDVMIGTIETSAVRALARGELQRGRALAAVALGGERLAASADGDAVFQRTDEHGWQVLVRADGGYVVPLTSRLALRVEAGLEVRPAPVEIRVEGAREPHASPALRLVVGAGLTWRVR